MKDVTQVIKEAWDKGQRLLSVELDLGQQNQRKPEEALSVGNPPYLLLHADDQALAEPNSVAASLQRYDPFTEAGEESSQTLHRPNSSSQSKERVRREAALPFDLIQNNELPEVEYKPDGFRKDDLWESTWYLKPKSKERVGKKEEKRKSHEDKAAKDIREKQEGSEPRVLEQGERTTHGVIKKHDQEGRTQTVSDGRKHERRNEGKDVKKPRGHSNAQSPVLSFDERTMRNARRKQWSTGQNRGCSRRNLRVDFADIGWSEWVIAPKAFEAYYCAGTCEFPMPKVRTQDFSFHPNMSRWCFCLCFFSLSVSIVSSSFLPDVKAIEPRHHPEYSASSWDHPWGSRALLCPRKDESPGRAVPG